MTTTDNTALPETLTTLRRGDRVTLRDYPTDGTGTVIELALGGRGGGVFGATVDVRWDDGAESSIDAEKLAPTGQPLPAVFTPTPEDPAYVTLDPRSGRVIGLATDTQRDAYLAQPAAPAFRQAVRVGDVLVDTYVGPAMPAWSQGCE